MEFWFQRLLTKEGKLGSLARVTLTRELPEHSHVSFSFFFLHSVFTRQEGLP